MEHVPRPPPRMVRLSDLQSAWECSRSAGLEMRNPKVTLKSQIGHLEPVLGPVEKIKEFEDLGLLAGRVLSLFSKKMFQNGPTPATSEPGYALGGTSSPVLFEHVSREDDGS